MKHVQRSQYVEKTNSDKDEFPFLSKERPSSEEEFLKWYGMQHRGRNISEPLHSKYLKKRNYDSDTHGDSTLDTSELTVSTSFETQETPCFLDELSDTTEKVSLAKQFINDCLDDTTVKTSLTMSTIPQEEVDNCSRNSELPETLNAILKHEMHQWDILLNIGNNSRQKNRGFTLDRQRENVEQLNTNPAGNEATHCKTTDKNVVDSVLSKSNFITLLNARDRKRLIEKEYNSNYGSSKFPEEGLNTKRETNVIKIRKRYEGDSWARERNRRIEQDFYSKFKSFKRYADVDSSSNYR